MRLISPDKTLRRVADFVSTHGLLADTDHVLVGFSGGPDSTALLLLLGELTCRPAAVHLHHGLRGQAADRDAEWCARFCAARSIPFECHRLDVPRRRRSREGVEAAARRCRLDFWQERAATPRTTVALGHHLDDAAEDLLLRLIRGANATGLTGLRPLRQLGSLRLIRPLLCLRRADVEQYLATRDVRECCHDATNADLRLRRGMVRHRLLPLIRHGFGTDLGLQQSLRALREDADYLEAAARAALPRLGSIPSWTRLHPALLPRVLRAWLRTETGRDVIPRAEAVCRLRSALLQAEDGKTRTIPLGEGLALTLSRRGVRVAAASSSAGDTAAAPASAEAPAPEPPVGTVTDGPGPGPAAQRRSPARMARTRPRDGHGDVPVAGVAGLSPRRWEWQHEPCLELPEIGARLLADIVPVPSEERIRRHPATVEYYDVAAVPSVLEVRGWLAGDRIRAFGSDEPRKLQDLFVNCGIARGQRRSLPIVCAGGEIIWVAGVRRAEFARLAVPRPATVLCLRCLRPGQPRQPRRQARPGARSTQRSRSR